MSASRRVFPEVLQQTTGFSRSSHVYNNPTFFPLKSCVCGSHSISGEKAELRNSVSLAGSNSSKFCVFRPTTVRGLSVTPKIRYPPEALANDAIVLAYSSRLPKLKISLNSMRLFSRDFSRKGSSAWTFQMTFRRSALKGLNEPELIFAQFDRLGLTRNSSTGPSAATPAFQCPPSAQCCIGSSGSQTASGR